MYQNVVEQRDGKKKKKTKKNLEAIRGKGSHPEIRDCTGKKEREIALRWEGSLWVHQEDKRSRARAICLAWEETCEKCWNIKGRLGWGSSFRAPGILAHFGHSSPLRNQKGDQMGRLVSQTPVKNCQQEVLSLPRPALPGKTPGGVGAGFPSGGHCVSPKRSTGLEDWCSASSRDRLPGSGS